MTPVEPGRHTLQVRSGRNSSRTKTFDAADGTYRRVLFNLDVPDAVTVYLYASRG